MYTEMLMEYAEFAKTASAEEMEALAKDVLEGLSKLASGENTSEEDNTEESTESEEKEDVKEDDKEEEGAEPEKKASTISDLIKSAGLGDVEYLAEDPISQIIKSAGKTEPEDTNEDSNGSAIGGAAGAAGLLAAGVGAVGLARRGKQGYHAAALSLSESKKKAAEATAAKHKAALSGTPGLGSAPGSSSTYTGYPSDKPLQQHKLKEESKKMDNRVATNFEGSDGKMYTRDMEAITGDAKSLERADFIQKHKKAIAGTAAGVGAAAYLSNENSKKDKELQGAYGVGRR